MASTIKPDNGQLIIKSIKDLDLNIDPSQMSNPQEILSNLPNDSEFDTNEIFS